ncbi:MAG: tRNA preQ1(34) S-adenosylmethionine ribosyltransferase-isomerase QueA [Spirochaetaceae bacterium]|nr:tRNA preQ1(34) S-adenosylmethionine ribosyltransferase-isomerase QueA [Spirochaetaceae bacterium]
MLTKDFYFDLPTELIAQHPSGVRGQDKLMVLEKTSGKVFHYMMNQLPELVPQDTLMIFNDSKVRHSRVYGIKESTGGECEFLFIQPLADNSWKALTKNAKKQRSGCKYQFPDGTTATIINNPSDEGTEFRTLQFDRIIDESWFEKNGHIPLPPYIRREDTFEDKTRYQNVYAKETGSSACPTAGLHFTEEMLNTLENNGIERAWVTLHVGLGTFLPVRTEQIQNHKMHYESYSISNETANLVTKAKKEGRPILAVGTTSVRTLESAWNKTDGYLTTGTGSTNIFIYPGYNFNVVDKLFTNFHTPESTLLMLVSAFAGKENIMNAYNLAIKNRYRFFSYGDAMLIL